MTQRLTLFEFFEKKSHQLSLIVKGVFFEQELWIDKNTGRLCVSVSSKALRITGVDDRRYWSQIPTDESR